MVEDTIYTSIRISLSCSCGFGSLPRLVSSRIVSRYSADMCVHRTRVNINERLTARDENEHVLESPLCLSSPSSH